MTKYPSLKRAILDKEFLKSIGSNYSFIFGALGELVDNSRDAGAHNLRIYSEKSINLERSKIYADFMLYFSDDGCGMSPSEAENVIVFGHSNKNGEKLGDFVGQYGTGLKSGSMRVANDFIVFTKKDSIFTVTMLSRTFFNDQNITEIIVPIPSFVEKNGHLDTYIPEKSNEREINTKQKEELGLIFKYSPFKHMDDLKKQFDSIEKNGTTVILYNLFKEEKRTGWKPILDVTSQLDDIQIDKENFEDDTSVPEECRSLRAYLEIIYSNPRMKIYIQNIRVKTRCWAQVLYFPCEYKWICKKVFNEKAQSELRNAEDTLKDAEFQLGKEKGMLEVLKRELLTDSGKDSQMSKREVGEKLKNVQNLTLKIEEYKKACEEKKKNLHASTTILFKFGINLNNRGQDGFFFYNQHRLMIMHNKADKGNQSKPEYSGIVGYVDIPYSVMAPSQNKQGFMADNELKKLKQEMLKHLDDYYYEFRNELTRIKRYEDLDKFWDDMGYANYDCAKPYDISSDYVKRRNDRVKTYIQCDKCLKFRKLPNRPSDVGKTWPHTTVCGDLPCGNCSKPEDVISFKELKLSAQKRVFMERPINAPASVFNVTSRASSVAPSARISDSSSRLCSVRTSNDTSPTMPVTRIKRSASDMENEQLFNVLMPQSFERENTHNTRSYDTTTAVLANKKTRVLKPAGDDDDDSDDPLFIPGRSGASTQAKSKIIATKRPTQSERITNGFEIEIDYDDDRDTQNKSASNQKQQVSLFNSKTTLKKSIMYSKDQVNDILGDKLLYVIKRYSSNPPQIKSFDDLCELDLNEVLDSIT